MKKILIIMGTLTLSAGLYAATMLTDTQAGNIALGQTNNGQITKIELDRENGRTVYEVEVMEGNVKKEFDIDAYSGKILKVDGEIKPGYTNVQMQASSTNTQNQSLISMEDAKQIALKNSKSGGTIKSIELDYDNGYPIYEIEVKEGMFTEREFKIDAVSGQILKNKLD